jgi:uncharacterized sporulation protein YeaH/YhbH (DUF444 family)
MRGALGRRIALGAESRRELHALEDLVAQMLRQPSDDPAVKQQLKEAQERIAARRPLGASPSSTRSTCAFAAGAGAGAHQQGGDVLPDGRLRLDGRAAQGAGQALLHPALPVPDPPLREDRAGLHPPPHPGSGGDEDDFFHARETGGTVVSSALELMDQIIRERYNPTEWNIYGAQASDGDNWHHDSGRCRELLAEKMLPACRYYAYVQVAEEEQNLWEEYTRLGESHPNFAMRKAVEASEIYPVFRDLFKKEGATT